QDGVGRVGHNFRYNVLHDLEIGVQQVVTAHARLAGNSGGDDHDVRIRRVRVIIGAEHKRIALLHRHGFGQIQSLALRDSFEHVNQYYVGQFLGRDPVSCRGAHVASSHDCYFLTHEFPSLPVNVTTA